MVATAIESCGLPDAFICDDPATTCGIDERFPGIPGRHSGCVEVIEHLSHFTGTTLPSCREFGGMSDDESYRVSGDHFHPCNEHQQVE